MELKPFRVVHSDDDFVVIDKSCGISTQRARMDDANDLIALVEAECGAPLGVHQRLDRETSGVMVFARSSAGNQVLRAAFAESRSAQKEYLAVVQKAVAVGTLRHFLVHDDGVSNCASSADPHAKEAITEVVECTEQAPRRFLLRLVIHTGRTHQIRAQLAHIGAAIVGDTVYGGARCGRLLLHACRLAFQDDRKSARHEFVVPAPPEVSATNVAISAELNWARTRRHFVDHTKTNAFRLLHESETFEGLTAIDSYDGHWIVHSYHDDLQRGRTVATELWHAAQTWPSTMRPSSLFLKCRPRAAHALSDAEKAELVAEHPMFGECPPSFIVRESGMSFVVRPGDGLSAGLFLDQRDNRAWIRREAAAKNVLNLFAYTCGFSLAAWLGGATRVTSVDVSKRLLAWGQENFSSQDIRPPDASNVQFFHDDVFAFLSRAVRRADRYDLIVVDPPTFATTKKSRFTSGKDWQRLLAQVLHVASDRAQILASSNDRRMSQREFRAFVHAALAEVPRASEHKPRIIDIPEPRDFPSAPWFSPHLKAVRVEL